MQFAATSGRCGAGADFPRERRADSAVTNTTTSHRRMNTAIAFVVAVALLTTSCRIARVCFVLPAIGVFAAGDPVSRLRATNFSIRPASQRPRRSTSGPAVALLRRAERQNMLNSCDRCLVRCSCDRFRIPVLKVQPKWGGGGGRRRTCRQPHPSPRRVAITARRSFRRIILATDSYGFVRPFSEFVLYPCTPGNRPKTDFPVSPTARQWKFRLFFRTNLPSVRPF